MPVTAITSKKSFQEILENNDVVFIDFYAQWCPPCKAIAPMIEKWSEEDEYGKITFAKVDVDEVGDVAQECGISAMPTFLIFKKGEKVGELVGANPPAVQSLLAKSLE